MVAPADLPTLSFDVKDKLRDCSGMSEIFAAIHGNVMSHAIVSITVH